MAQRALGDVKLDELARRLRMGPSAVSHMRRRMAWPLVAAGDSVFGNWLSS
jgi:hypothetical protein